MSEQLEILAKIESGEITPEEGAKLIEELSNQPSLNKEQTSDQLSQMEILEKIERGELSASDGTTILSEATIGVNNGNDLDEGTQVEISTAASIPISDAEFRKWKSWWMLPLYIGFAIFLQSIIWMNSSYQNNNGVNFWFFCAWVPLTIGLIFIAITWFSRSGPWIHVRVKNDDGKSRQNVKISIPLFLRPTTWLLRTFGHLIPKLERDSIDALIFGLENSFTSNNPLHIQVNEEDDGGEQVDVYIG